MKAACGRSVAALVAVIGMAVSAAPSRAGEDGQASLLSGLASTFGLSKEDKTQIEYHERAKLVIPPKRTLQPPAAGNVKDAAWPTDVEILRDRKEKKEEDAEPSAKDRMSRSYTLVQPGQDVSVTTSGFDRHGPACRVPDPKTGECPEAAHGGMDWNPLTWVGLQKKQKLVLGSEPERENLVDPPKGYRMPAEGVGAKVEN